MRQVVVGDQAVLVDQLIESSQIRPPAGSTYSGYGRDLVPFFDMHEPVGNAALMGTLESTKRGLPRHSPRTTSQHKLVPRKMHSPNRASYHDVKEQAVDKDTAVARRIPKKTIKNISTETEVFCAPGFSQSPKPEALPLPTLALMQKALAKTIASCKSASYGQTASTLTALRVTAV